MNIVIYGGTFSPPHNGHINAAKTLLKYMSPDMFVIMPTGLPPHKDSWGSVCGEDRFEMCKAAFGDISNIVEVSDYEIKKASKSYTYETAKHFKSVYPDADITFLCGEDMIMSLDSWYNARRLMEECSFAAVLRNRKTSLQLNEKINYLRDIYGAKISVLECDPTDISSGQIRNMICDGKNIGGLVPNGVVDIIKEKNLYFTETKG